MHLLQGRNLRSIELSYHSEQSKAQVMQTKRRCDEGMQYTNAAGTVTGFIPYGTKRATPAQPCIR